MTDKISKVKPLFFFRKILGYFIDVYSIGSPWGFYPWRNLWLYIFLSQVRSVTALGYPLIEGLEQISKTSYTWRIRRIANKIIASLNQGHSLSHAFGQMPFQFPKSLVSLVRAGEKSGEVSKAIQIYQEYNRLQQILKIRLIHFLSYLGVIFTVFLGIWTVLMVWIIPVFAQMYSDMGHSLPTTTLFFMNFSDSMINQISHLFWLIAIIYLAFLINRKYSWVSRLPILHQMISTRELYFSTQAIQMLLSHGVSLSEAMEICAEGIKTPKVKEDFYYYLDQLKSGNVSPRFPARSQGILLFSSLKQTGDMTKILESPKKYYQRMMEKQTSKIKAYFLPVTLSIMGIFVLFFLVSMYIPIFSIATNIQN